MRSASRSTTMVAGAVVMALLAGAVYLALTASTGLPGQQHRFVDASFPSVGGLRAGDDVRRASVRIGQVRSIELNDGRALVTMQLDKDEPVYKDAKAAIQARSALGQSYVELSPGSSSAGEFRDEGLITGANATEPANLDEVLSTFDRPTRRELGSMLRQVGGGATGHSSDLHAGLSRLPDVVENLGTISETASADSTDLAGLLRATDSLASRFDGHETQVAALTKNLGTTLDAVAVDEGRPVSQTLESAPTTLKKARSALVSLRTPLGDLTDAMTTLHEGAASLGRATPDLRGTLRESLTPVGKVSPVAEQALPAVESLSDLLADARPLAPRVEDLLNSTHTPSAVLAPYAPEIARFFTYWANANRFRDKSGHYLRIDLIVRPDTFDGATGIRDPLVHRNPYPAPGQAAQDRATTLLGSN